jgi:hypothetical protein
MADVEGKGLKILANGFSLDVTGLEGGQRVISLSDSAVTAMCQIIALTGMAGSRIDVAQSD